MGNKFGQLMGKKPTNILILGLDAAGKSTMMYRMKLGEVVTTIPTIGFNVETVSYKKVNFTAWDVGGRCPIRPLWRHFMKDTSACIFVVDANDKERMEYAKQELHRTLSDIVDISGKIPLLVFCNKVDLPSALGTNEVVEQLDLHSLRGHKWYVQESVMTSGTGLYEGMDWLSQQCRNKVSQTPSLFSEAKSESGNIVKSMWDTFLSIGRKDKLSSGTNLPIATPPII